MKLFLLLVNYNHILSNLCRITGKLPRSIGISKKLINFFVYRNRLTGKLILVEYFKLLKTFFSGTIPVEFGDVLTLATILLQDNQLHGPLSNLFKLQPKCRTNSMYCYQLRAIDFSG